MGIEGYKKPEGDPRAAMVGPGAWPETDESDFTDRNTTFDGIHSKLTGAMDGWKSGQSYLKAEHTWFGVAATTANGKVDTHTKAMEQHEQQLITAKGWFGEAAGLINKVKGAIVETVETAVDVINDTISKSNENNTDSKTAVKNIKEKAYAINQTIVQWGADTVAGKEGVKPEPPKHGKAAKEAFQKAAGEPGNGESGGPEGDAGGNQTNSSLLSFAGRNGLSGKEPASYKAPPAKKPADPPAGVVTHDLGGKEPASYKAPPAEKAADPPAGVVAHDLGGKEPTGYTPPLPVVNPGGNPPPAAGKSPTPAAPTPPVPSAPSTGGSTGTPGGTGASGAPSPLSGGLSGSGVDQAASASQAAGQAPAGAAPTDPLQAFSNGFADSAGTPVHAASTSAPPLAPAPAVPASDAMAPASTHSAPTSLSSAPAPAAPIQGTPVGGSMGMGGGMPSMPLGPPPTAPPAGPVAPPPASAPPIPQPANIAGGAQVAPIPVSAARAQRDAAQDAAKRSGSDPLVLARRVAAALNAPDMVDEEDFIFFWITAVTVDGKIVVANNYGLAFIPEQVQLPEQVAMATADESIPPAERASWVTHPVVAVQRWAQHHNTKLRAVIATEDQFKNSDAGVHQEVLTPEDIPAKGQMAGRDRLKVIAPEIAARFAQFSDGDLVKVLPPAPVDTNPPEDRRLDLWDAVWQPLCSGASNRSQVHLQAFLEYASHAQEWAVYEAHAAGDGPEQRRAVADFIYWQHIGQLVADAMAE
ncbi:hypothetical protein [Mycobacterium sp. DL440]|uniref:hypothetical protein n=1 Tax=Mycobacterium sp. DL440 TaxID=2675523 RepID=UPI001FB9DF54|nr:hypothetical protein [Mycobacterium sp. DL440]